jgi:YebC/PmpR family DNA-binding regulatory protein
MSGHSKWSTIKHKKAAVDAKRGKLFTRLTKEITVSAREGGGDPEFNNRLALAIQKAKDANMPKDNIERAIKRGTGELEGQELVEILYEAYAPHGIGMMIEVVTDNRNRAVAELRHALTKNGGNLAESGAVSWQFTRKGYITITEEVDEDELFLIAADAGAEDIDFGDGMTEIYVGVDRFQAVQNALKENEIKLEEAKLIYEPNNPMDLAHRETIQVMRVLDELDDLDDVQNIHSALDIDDAAIAEMEGA